MSIIDPNIKNSLEQLYTSGTLNDFKSKLNYSFINTFILIFNKIYLRPLSLIIFI